MRGEIVVALVAGVLFGAGLAISGMVDPVRVRGFLDVAGAWDPTLAFVMGGALVPMILAWRIRGRLDRPAVATAFDLPQATVIDGKLVAGAAIFGIGWGIGGLCPGPGLADLALEPVKSGLFVIAMLAGMVVHRILAASPRTRFWRAPPRHASFAPISRVETGKSGVRPALPPQL